MIKPAEAGAEKLRILARAEAVRTRIQAEAAASSNRVALDQALIAQLPQIVEKAAQGLAGANVTMLNGSDGLSDMISGLAAQGMAIFDALRSEVGSEKPVHEMARPEPKGIAGQGGANDGTTSPAGH